MATPPHQRSAPTLRMFHATTSPMALGASTTSSDLAQFVSSNAQLVATSAAGLFSILALCGYFYYRTAINRRLKQVTEESWIFGAGVTMERVKQGEKGMNPVSTTFSNLKLLELNPEFQKKYEKEGWSLMSLGDYLASLRPKNLPQAISVDALPIFIQREIEAGLGTALLKALGPGMGRALLPAVGIGPVKKQAESLAANLATKWFMSSEGISPSKDKGGVPVSLMTVFAASDLNARINSGRKDPLGIGEDEQQNVLGFTNMNMDSIQKMKAGEVKKGFTFDDTLVPQNFVVSRDFDRAIRGMEEKLGYHGDQAGGQGTTELQIIKTELVEEAERDSSSILSSSSYDPESRRMAAPIPINERLFPDLHLGWGSAKSSHTNREVLKMRLLSVLLNKLASNYHRQSHGETDLFTVQMEPGGESITNPGNFVQALMDSGHTIEMVPTSHLTTFGVCLCVKEDHDSWTNIPMAVFVESGYEDKNGNIAPAMMPHSGLDMFVKGPLAGSRADGTPSTLRIQHFEGIEGFCGWNSNEHADVPFNQDVEGGPRLTGQDAVRGIRVAALYATILNGLAAKLQLPFGGYGLTAVCNDSAALVQHVLYNKSTIYPMTSIGRFLQRAMRYGQTLQEDFVALQTRTNEDLTDEIRDLQAITDAMTKIPSDLNASPSSAASATRRMLATLQPEKPFVLMSESKRVSESIQKEHEEANNIRVRQGGGEPVLVVQEE